MVLAPVLDLPFFWALLHVSMLLRQDFLVLDWLDFCMMMVLVYFAVDWLIHFLVLFWLHIFMFHCWVDSLCSMLVSLFAIIGGRNLGRWTYFVNRRLALAVPSNVTFDC